MDGDERAAITDLYERYATAVYRYAARRSGGATAEEVTAQVFLVAWRRRSELPRDALPWLYGVARRALADERRAASRRSRLGTRLRSTAVTEPWQQEFTDGSLAAALSRLRELDREVLLLCYWEELEPEKIARAIGRSKTATAVRLHRARQRLRRELERGSDDRVKSEEAVRPCAVKAESR